MLQDISKESSPHHASFPTPQTPWPRPARALAPPPTSHAHSPCALAWGRGGQGRGAAAAAACCGQSVLAARRTHKCRCACAARVRLLDNGGGDRPQGLLTSCPLPQAGRFLSCPSLTPRYGPFEQCESLPLICWATFQYVFWLSADSFSQIGSE